MKMSTESEMLTVADVARILNVSKHTIYGWRRKKIAPPHIQVNGAIRFPKDRLMQWIDSASVESTSGRCAA